MMGIETNLQLLKERVQAVVDSTAGHVSYVIEDGGGQRLDKDAYVTKKAASLIKIPIMMAAFKQVEAGILSLSDRYSIDTRNIVSGAGVIQFMDGDTSFTLGELLTLMIIVSDNTATNKVIDIIGWNGVNDFCREQGLTNTKLERKMMDFKATAAGIENRTSALEMIECLKYLHIEDAERAVFSDESRQKMLRILGGQQLLDKLPFYMDLELVGIANKTGELPGVEHDCGIVTYKGEKLFVAVLIDDLVDNSIGKRAIQEIGKVVEEYLVETEAFC
ncbi:serine hydrolase [Sutcliffiella horikoshii]|uniref:Serine hydrolase n=1 Tax=Sutcliffiella horikoshii TaxID=79883 RepID=A0ABM6KL49_9BACI|nr:MULTISPECIES: serine hydrolase [Bacillaceae]ART77231.1 serine hydrolase [Sutcliffiella horikoshii]